MEYKYRINVGNYQDLKQFSVNLVATSVHGREAFVQYKVCGHGIAHVMLDRMLNLSNQSVSEYNV